MPKPLMGNTALPNFQDGLDPGQNRRFKSMHAFIKKTIRDKLAALGRQEIKKALLEASKNPLFLADIKEVQKDFARSDFEEGEK